MYQNIPTGQQHIGILAVLMLPFIPKHSKGITMAVDSLSCFHNNHFKAISEYQNVSITQYIFLDLYFLYFETLSILEHVLPFSIIQDWIVTM